MLCLNKTTAWSEQGDISHWRQNKFREERENKRTLTDLRIPKTTASTRTFLQPGGGGTLCTNSKPTVGPYCWSRTRTPKHTLSLPRIEINLPAQCLENTLCKTIRAAQTELRKEGREQRRNERTGKVAFYLSQSFFFFKQSFLCTAHRNFIKKNQRVAFRYSADIAKIVTHIFRIFPLLRLAQKEAQRCCLTLRCFKEIAGTLKVVLGCPN